MTVNSTTHDKARDKTRRTVSKMIEGSGLRIQEFSDELVVTNPQEPDQGQIHIVFVDGRVLLERTTWECLGPLKGPGNGKGRKVTAGKDHKYADVNQGLVVFYNVSIRPQDQAAPGQSQFCHRLIMCARKPDSAQGSGRGFR